MAVENGTRLMSSVGWKVGVGVWSESGWGKLVYLTDKVDKSVLW